MFVMIIVVFRRVYSDNYRYICNCCFQAGIDSERMRSAIDLTVGYLENAISSGSLDNDPYSLSIVANALTLAGRPSGEDALAKLNNLATEEGTQSRVLFRIVIELP